MDTLLSLTSTLVLPFWLAMIVAPTWRWTERILRSPLPVVLFAAVYAVLVLPRLPELAPVLIQPNLPSIAALLGTPAGATIGWVHFLACDLFVGRWAYLDSRARGLNPWLMAPILALTLLFGPLGFLVYVGVPSLRSVPALARAQTSVWFAARPILGSLVRVNRDLTVVGVLMLVTRCGTLVGLVLDPRVITGAPAWLKPAKFAISTSIYAFTLVWLLGFVRGHTRLVAVIANTVAVGLTIEVAVIVLQVVRGTTSHFNLTTPLDGALFSTMGALIVLVWLMSALAAGLLIVQRMPDAVFAWSLRLGLLIALVGMVVAFFTLPPSPDQAAALAAGAPTAVGAHSVGVPDGGPGLPIVGWSTLGGDLRVAHFLGLHGLQALPLFGWLLTRLPRFGTRHGLLLVWTAGVTYLGGVVILTWQALRGQSVIAPDAATLAAFGILFGLAGVSAGAVVLRAWFSPSRSKLEAANGVPLRTW